jgi:export-related chaperone CsaA
MFISMATIEDFQKLDIRVGKIIDIQDAETRKPMYVLKVDFGELGIKQAIAGIKPYYTKEELLNKKFVFVVNLEPKKIANIMSECMILAASYNDKEEVVVLQPERDIEVGSRVS